jgi:hypothetical protein
MQLTISGKRATISLLLMVMLATILLRAIFFAEWFLSFLPPACNSARSSATLPCREQIYGKLVAVKAKGTRVAVMIDACPSRRTDGKVGEQQRKEA